eukprot:CAMPEP_0173429918 /NCGR_PEP_ID=MMETSP1357-20121228/8499_1 /TAXON_ID=77926 /ORGANISM="Hemiselmis rufescens, Strain PCC563" /LENGTH=78 /DNA_ID=CAMNT_0014394175 /DNA_START=1 /DNA_END=237 /DNA_ORIENTATION=+
MGPPGESHNVRVTRRLASPGRIMTILPVIADGAAIVRLSLPSGRFKHTHGTPRYLEQPAQRVSLRWRAVAPLLFRVCD